jgi:hypothetical protein
MRDRTETAESLTAALQEVLSDLTKTFQDWKVPYGEVNRLARSTGKGKPPFGTPPFDDDEPSLPLAAVNGNDGAVFTLDTTPGKQNRRRYGVAGDTYVSVIEFGPQPRALSVMTYGESGDPKSPHFYDQASLFVKGQFKPSWFTLDEVKKNAESVYHPGDRSTDSTSLCNPSPRGKLIRANPSHASGPLDVSDRIRQHGLVRSLPAVTRDILVPHAANDLKRAFSA